MGRGRTGDRVYERQNSDFILEAEESCLDFKYETEAIPL